MTSRRARRTIATLVAALALLVPGVAHAAPGYGDTELILIADGVVKDQGSEMTVGSEEGCEPTTDVTFDIDGEAIGTVEADAEGGFLTTVQIEEEDEAGVYELTATCGEYTDSLWFVVIDRDVFTDTVPNAFYEVPVAWASARGITTGVGGSDQFMPNASTTRGETVTFLWRLFGEPDGYDDAEFTDTIDDAFYEAAVNWAAAEGITTGVGGEDVFEPDRPVTRGEFVTFMWRAFGSPEGAPPADFDDTVDDAFYEDAVNWAAAEGITTGVGGENVFEPMRDVTRGEVVTFVHRGAVWAGGALGPA